MTMCWILKDQTSENLISCHGEVCAKMKTVRQSLDSIYSELLDLCASYKGDDRSGEEGSSDVQEVQDMLDSLSLSGGEGNSVDKGDASDDNRAASLNIVTTKGNYKVTLMVM